MDNMPKTIGVVGAGTMGAGIAQLACLAGARTLLHDPDPAALARGAGSVEANLGKGARHGRWTADAATAAARRLETADALEALAACELVIEAAPERLPLKQELFARLSAIVSPDCVLATNTSSLLVTAIASAATRPERVVGMHFFNPAPLMRLLEVVAGVRTGERALAVAHATGAAMGKLAIDAADGPGFLVNRVNRPFSLEAQRLLSERIADATTIDRICRLGGGFRMGPFELMDLVGVDVGLDIARSFHEQSFGEPRWRPTPLVARMVAAGLTGRKAGRGFYDYGDGEEAGAYRPADPPPPEELPGAGEHDDALVVVAGQSALAHDLLDLAAAAGWDARTPHEADGELPFLILDCGADDDDPPLQGGPQAILCHEGSLATLDPGGAAVGFHLLPPLAPGTLVELTRGPDSHDAAARAAETFFASIGSPVAWVGDAPGLVLGRIVCQLVNEAAFAVAEGVGSPQDVDAGVVHGLNHPRGILAWGDEIGLDQVLTVLDALAQEHGERYRAAPLLRRLVLSERYGRATGEGFFADGEDEDEDTP